MTARFLAKQGSLRPVLGIRVFPLPKRMTAAITLVEVLVVVVVVGALFAFMLPTLRGALLQARKTHAITSLRQLGIASEIYSQGDESTTNFDTRILVQIGLLEKELLSDMSDLYQEGQMNAARRTFIPGGQPAAYRDSVLNGSELIHPRLLSMIRQSGAGGWARIATFGPVMTPKWFPRHSSKSLLLRFDGSVGYAQDDRRDVRANTCDWFSFPLPCPPHKAEDFLE